MAARGYTVIGAPFFEWDKRADPKRQKQQPSAQQVQYLLLLINTATQQHQGNTHHDGYHHQQQQQQQAAQGTAGSVHASAPFSSCSLTAPHSSSRPSLAGVNGSRSSTQQVLLQGPLLALLLLPPAAPAPVAV
jgi:hypothetical protein